MMEWICMNQSKVLVSFGLFFNIFGAILIYKNAVKVKRSEEIRGGVREQTLTIGEGNPKAPYLSKAGIIFLIIGFTLQFAGTILS